jgi:chromosome segregation ATPase
MQNEAKNLNITTQKHTEIIENLQKEIDTHTKTIENLQKNIEAHTKAIKSMQKTIEKHGEILEAHTKAIESMQKAIESLQRSIEKHGEILEANAKAIEAMRKDIYRLDTEIGSFTNRASKGLERSIMKIYKGALKLHGVDPSNVKHGKIKDTLGIVDKDKEYEVDFYETDDYVYVFEVKNYADEGV